MSAAQRPRAAFATGRATLAPDAGLGLRFPHQHHFIDGRPEVAWLEVHAENYMGYSAATQTLERIRNDYPVSLHGVGMSLGSPGRLDAKHLERLKALAHRIEPCLVSEHLSWNQAGGLHLPDLLPLPLTEEALDVVAGHVSRLQDALGRQVLIENPSSYFEYRHSTSSEPEFLSALARRTGCGILCDVNNIYVSARNHGWSASAYLAALPAEAVHEYHLAGHASVALDGQACLIDDHGSPVAPAVWQLYREALRVIGPRPTLIERDQHLPPLPELLAEARHAGQLLAHAVAEPCAEALP